MFRVLSIVIGLSLFFVSTLEAASKKDCRHLLEKSHRYLEKVEGERALRWVTEQNQKTFGRLESDARFDQIKKRTLELLNAEDRIVYGSFRGGKIYNFWQDADNVRGLIRRSSSRSYLAGNPKWETVLDLDQLAKSEGENWVYKGSISHEESNRAMILLSRGGKDAVVAREFDYQTKSFVEGGFSLPEAKMRITYEDADTLIVGTDFGADSQTDSGYPRILKRWKRGQSLDQAQTVLEGKKEDVSVFSVTLGKNDQQITLVSRWTTFFTSQSYILRDSELIPLELPEDIEINAHFKGLTVYTLKSDWQINGQTFKQGSVVTVDLNRFAKNKESVALLLEPHSKMTIQQIGKTKDSLFVQVLENVRGKVYEFRQGKRGWLKRTVPLPEMGATSMISADGDGHQILFEFESFLTPPSIYRYNARTKDLKQVYQLPDRFDASQYQAEQHWATSKDGTEVPYFLISKKNLVRNGSNPTLLYGYGGFEISRTPFYSGSIESAWLARGGVYVLANIRGGGEFGPAWHQAALKENRQRAYDDFIAIAEDLIARGITTPRHLGIQGGSNGGLLTGVATTQRPDLFNAALIQVPLLDMLRFHKLLAGASWVGEYGSPDNPEMRKVLAAYSPYHNVFEDTSYPEVFLMTSTKDDRVHPGHARKMGKKMEDQGHPFFYYENTEGGHGGAANNGQRAVWAALQWVYLLKKLK